QDATADPQHHRPVPVDQGRERILIVPGNEAFQELAVGLIGHARGADQVTEMSQDSPEASVGHEVTFPRRFPYLIMSSRRGTNTAISGGLVVDQPGIRLENDSSALGERGLPYRRRSVWGFTRTGSWPRKERPKPSLPRSSRRNVRSRTGRTYP